MVVALDLEDDGVAVAEIESARVLARSLEYALALRRERLQQQRRVLVPAVLRPEEGEDGELEIVGLTSEQGADTVELPVREAEGAMERLFRNAGQGTTQAASLARSPDSLGGTSTRG
jgi:hypothetical protein